MWNEWMLDPSAGKFVAGAKWKRISGYNILHPVKERKGTKITSRNVSPKMHFYALNYSTTFMVLIPLTTLDLQNNSKSIFSILHCLLWL